LLGACLPLSGCLVTRVVTVPVKLAATTVVAVGETSGAVVSTTAKVTSHVVRAGGDVADAGVDSAARLAKSGMVTFVDSATGNVTRVAWTKGLTLATGAETAKVQLALHAAEVIRDGHLFTSAAKEILPLVSGDVVRLKPLP
jgi:hypothetical protein